MKLFEKYKIPTALGFVASSAEDAEKAAKQIAEQRVGAKDFVVKAQVLAGGRGKGHFDNGFQGGVHLTKDPTVVAGLCNAMIGNKLITKQTPPEGIPVSK